MWLLFELIINLFQGFLMIYFIHQRMWGHRRFKWWIEIISILAIGCFLSSYLFFSPSIPDTVVFLFPLLYAIVTKRGSWLQRIIWVLVLGVVFTTVTTLSFNMYSELLGISMEVLAESNILRLSYVITTNIAIAIALNVLVRIGNDTYSYFLTKFSSISFIALLVLQFASIEILYIYLMRGQKDEQLLVLIDLSILMMVAVTLVLYEIMNRSARNKHLVEMKLKTVAMTEQHQTEMLAVYNEMLAIQHDLRHQVNIAKQMLAKTTDGDRRKVVDLLDDIEEPQGILTGCVMVDAILTAKKAMAEQEGISFQQQIYPLYKLPIEEADFGVLLSNILDNAIEAVQRIEERELAHRFIDLQFARSWNMFYIVCKNSINPSTIHYDGNRLVSSKNNKYLHGFGVENVRNTVKRYKGNCEIEIKDGTFSIKIILPDQED